MAIVRTYECDSCGTKFDKLHFDRSEPAPPCPGCSAIESKQVPAGFAIGGTASKAGDIAYDIMSKDLGFTDMKDNLRAGDTAAPSLPSHLQKAAGNFWNAGGSIIAAAKQGAKASQAEGSNPLMITQRARKSQGNLTPVRCNPVATAR